MSKTTLYEWENANLDELNNIEKESLKRAVDLNDKLIDVKTVIEEVTFEWKEYMSFLEDERISKKCEFYGKETIPFNEELLKAIVDTLKDSLNNTHKAIDYNSKKIGINNVIDG